MIFDRLTFQLSKSEEQLEKLSDVALSTLFSNPFGSLCLSPSWSGDILLFPMSPTVRPSDRLSACPSNCLSKKSCEGNSSYSVSWIFLKPFVCFCQGLKMWMTFGYNPQVIFFTFFAVLTLSFMDLKHLDAGYLVKATPSTVLTGSFRNFAVVLCPGLKMCHDEWRNPEANVCPFLQFGVSHF